MAAAASGELTKNGNLLVAFDGGISPQDLPRSAKAPVAVWVDTTLKTTDGTDPPPQLRQIRFAINREGHIFDRGLPTCRMKTIQPSPIAAARRACGDAIVGRGRVRLRIALDKEYPFTYKAPLLAFNAKPVNGHRRILVQVYGTDPPSSFVLTFTIKHREGTFGTVISTKLPKGTERWAYVTHFYLRLQRRYVYRGKRYSFISARCAAPAGIPGAVYPFAEATYRFAGGRTVTSTLTRTCTVR